MTIPARGSCRQPRQVGNGVQLSRQRAQEAVEGKGYWCEDPEWAMCETCHYILTTQGDAKLFEHSFLRQCLAAGRRIPRTPICGHPPTCALVNSRSCSSRSRV